MTVARAAIRVEVGSTALALGRRFESKRNLVRARLDSPAQDMRQRFLEARANHA